MIGGDLLEILTRDMKKENQEKLQDKWCISWSLCMGTALRLHQIWSVLLATESSWLSYGMGRDLYYSLIMQSRSTYKVNRYLYLLKHKTTYAHCTFHTCINASINVTFKSLCAFKKKRARHQWKQSQVIQPLKMLLLQFSQIL